MGRKSRRKFRQKGNDDFDDALMVYDTVSHHRKDAKHNAKQNRSKKKLMKWKMRIEEKKRGKHSDGANYKGWHTVTVTGGEPVEKDFLLTSIGNYVEVEFRPLGFYKLDRTSGFYLEGNKPAAIAIGELDKRLQGPDGTRLKIAVVECEVPELILNSDQLQTIREIMAQRYSDATCLLDLTAFHYDPHLMQKEILAPLTSTLIMKQVLRLIKENIPQLKALNLSKNNFSFSHLKVLQSLHESHVQLGALNFEHNNLRDLQILKIIKVFPITELSLKFNPVIASYKNSPLRYVKMVKSDLPSLKILDSIDIDTYITENTPSVEKKRSEIGGIASGSQSSSSTSGTSEALSEQMVRTFLEQYYALVDTPQRVNLVAAYTPDAVLEVKSTVSAVSSNIFVGQSKISEALAALPATQHQHSSFSLNIQPLGPSNMQAVVTGQCQIVGVDTVVSFSRAMNIVPFNTGFCCSQDLLQLQ